MKYYLMPDNEVCREVGSQREGLSSAEAESRLAKNGANRLAEAEKTPAGQPVKLDPLPAEGEKADDDMDKSFNDILKIFQKDNY